MILHKLFIVFLLLFLLSTLGIIMEQVNFGYSTKNIPAPTQRTYLKSLIAKTEKFLRAVRWRTFFYLNPEKTPKQKETFGFKSTKSPPPVPELKDFEDGMLNLVQNIKFKRQSKPFLNKLRNDTSTIKDDKKLFISADKTTNFYKVTHADYNKLMDDNISKSYKKASKSTEKNITITDKKIAAQLELDDRIDTTAHNQAFLTLKDHKPNFPNKPTCRLINPSKSELGKVSKKILDSINQQVRDQLPLNQWKNTDAVTKWFNNIDDKPNNTFITFDICEFYPSITHELLSEALEFASSYMDIPQDHKDIILHTKHSLLYSNNTAWCKRDQSNFDVTMGSYDGAETCDLVGLFILSKLQHLDINVGLYRDDGLAVCSKTPKQVDSIKKEICKIFGQYNLKITIDANKKSVNFLDINMDLRTGTYKPYTKPNNSLRYVHCESNHPPSVLRNIPESINTRLSNISSNEDIFNEAAPPYQEALKNSGYDYQLKYKPQHPNTNKDPKKRNRKRNITWYNPPFSVTVETNVGKSFLTLLDKCFPPGHQLHKLLNRNTIKISYSCMPNVDHIITGHNKSSLESEVTTNPIRTCNCRVPPSCPLQGKCLTSSVIYQATVTRQDNHKDETYVGLTEGTFKTRYYCHMNSFKNEKQRNATTLSQYIWKLHDKNVNYHIKWNIIARAKSYSPRSKRCNLCLTEKYFIICKPLISSLNNRNELVSACRHRRKHLLCNIDT